MAFVVDYAIACCSIGLIFPSRKRLREPIYLLGVYRTRRKTKLADRIYKFTFAPNTKHNISPMHPARVDLSDI